MNQYCFEAATFLHNFLSSVYECKEKFTLETTCKTPKTRAGYYKVDKKHIVVHGVGRFPMVTLKYIALHELAHHIHFTEFGCRKHNERVHGKEFYAIFEILLKKANM